MNSRERVLAMIEGRPVDRLPLMPITMMFAADQIGASYRDYVTDYQVLVEAQLTTAEKFGFDYVSVISDPAREAADCGAVVQFFDDQPPAIDENRALLKEKSRLCSLTVPDPHHGSRMSDRIAAVAQFRERIGTQKIIEGWIEGPCAEAADLRGINNLMLDFYDDPSFVYALFNFITEMELRFAQAQITAGAGIIGLGDAAASLVGPEIYEEFVWPYEKKLIDGLHALGAGVRLHICGNTNALLKGMGELDCDIVDLDSMVSLSSARDVMGSGQVLLGNINPVGVLRFGNPVTVTTAIAECHREAGPRYIIGAGCEIPRGTPDENVLALREYAMGTTA